MDDIALKSPLPPDECAARLREATGDGGLLTWGGIFSSRPVVGRVSVSAVRIRKQISYGGSFQTILVGRFEGQDGGTLFRGKTTIWTLLNVFMACWGGMVLLLFSLVGLAGMLGIIRPDRMTAKGPLWAPPALFVFMIAIGTGLTRFQIWLARDERRFLIAFVADTIASPSVPGGEIHRSLGN